MKMEWCFYVTSWLENKTIDLNNSFTIVFLKGLNVFVWNNISQNPPRKLRKRIL